MWNWLICMDLHLVLGEDGLFVLGVCCIKFVASGVGVEWIIFLSKGCMVNFVMMMIPKNKPMEKMKVKLKNRVMLLRTVVVVEI